MGLGNLNFVTGPSHIFQQNFNMQFSPARDLEIIQRIKINFQANIHFQLPHKIFPYFP